MVLRNVSPSMTGVVRLPYLHAALDQLVNVKEWVLEQLHGVGENPHKALFL